MASAATDDNPLRQDAIGLAMGGVDVDHVKEGRAYDESSSTSSVTSTAPLRLRLAPTLASINPGTTFHVPASSTLLSHDAVPSLSQSSSNYSIASLYPSSYLYPSSAVAESPKRSPRKAKTFASRFNIMLIGAVGSGKSSFAKVLLSNLSPSNAAAAATVEELLATRLCSTTGDEQTSVEIVYDGEKVNLSIIDTTGLEFEGDEMRTERRLTQILKGIEQNFDDALNSETSIFRSGISHINDSLIHLIIYFIEASSLTLYSTASSFAGAIPSTEDELRMNEKDLRAIKRLGAAAFVLPIVARSDELSAAQLTACKSIINQDFQRDSITFGPFSSSFAAEDVENEAPAVVTVLSRSNSQAFSRKRRTSSAPTAMLVRESSETTEDDGESEGVIQEEKEESFDHLLPFAIFAPETFDAKRHRFVREFRYGTADALDPAHSDFSALQRAIFDKMNILRDSTKTEKYEAYRTQRLLLKRATLSDPATTRNILRELSAL